MAVLHSLSGRLIESGRKEREMVDEREKVIKQTSSAPAANTVGQVFAKLVGRLGTESISA